MSERLRSVIRRTVCTVATLALTGAVATPLSAQSLTESLRRQRDLAIDAWVARGRADSVAVTRGRERLTDTIRANGITMLADREVADTARRALIVMDSVMAWRSIGRASSTGVTYRLRRVGAERKDKDSSKVTWYLERPGLSGHPTPVEFWIGPPPSILLGQKMAFDRTELVIQRLPQPFKAWLGGGLIDSSIADLWPNVYVRLATSPTLVAQRCMLGDMAGCRQVLLLDPVKDPITEWLTASARRQIAMTVRETVRNWTRDGDTRAQYETVHAQAMRCYDAADDSACTAFLRAIASDVVNDPLGTDNGRQTLVIAALQTSGAPGFSSILETAPPSTIAAIESLSGSSVDGVVERWRTRVMAAKPERVVLTAPRVLAALAWTLGLGALALKGSRWR